MIRRRSSWCRSLVWKVFTKTEYNQSISISHFNAVLTFSTEYEKHDKWSFCHACNFQVNMQFQSICGTAYWNGMYLTKYLIDLSFSMQNIFRLNDISRWILTIHYVVMHVVERKAFIATVFKYLLKFWGWAKHASFDWVYRFDVGWCIKYLFCF